MPLIQELPENQVTDLTPLNEREEIMVVQEVSNETDVFMEFDHLSAATNKTNSYPTIWPFNLIRKILDFLND